MEIKDIVEQEKHKHTLAKIKKREDALTRKQFLKDCKKFWKEYKKVESPYFLWLTLLKIHYWFDPEWFYHRQINFHLPSTYVEGSWFYDKWDFQYIRFNGYVFKRKSDVSGKYLWYRH